MDTIKINNSKTLTLTLPSDPTSNLVTVDLYHDLGDAVVKTGLTATRTALGIYTITFGQESSGIYVLSSAGVYKAKFSYTVSGVVYSQYQYFDVYTPYTDSESFFDEYPELITRFQDVFDKFELRVRNAINAYCGQSFDYFENKIVTVEGNNHTMLRLDLPIAYLNKVTMNEGYSDALVLYDVTTPNYNVIERVRQTGNFETSYYLKFKSSVVETNQSRLLSNRFKPASSYKVVGDFGWRFVPTNVKQAANLLIADIMNDDSEYRRHGISSISMDTTTFSMSNRFYETTGNIDADVLLMDYMMFIMDYIV